MRPVALMKTKNWVSSIAFVMMILILVMAQSLAAQDENSSLKGSSSESQSNSDLSDSKNQSGDQSASDRADDAPVHAVHVYITNNDNERLKIALFIDDDLKDSKEIASDSEAKMDSYELLAGPHSFKITWWDEDVRRSFEMEEMRDVREDLSVNLYTMQHSAPEKFDVTVKLTNENKLALDAFLYVDGSFEKSKEVGKESTSDIGTIKMEEGVHNLSVRWRDKETGIEYEKSRKIAVQREEAVAFYAPQGVSFEAQRSQNPSKESGSSRTRPVSARTASESASKSTAASAVTPSNRTAASNGSAQVDVETAGRPGASDDAALVEAIDPQRRSITSDGPRASVSSNQTDRGLIKSGLASDDLSDDEMIYLYAALVIAAVYLMLRH